MNHITKMCFLFLIAISSINCSKDDKVNSPFENFLGTWQLEYEVVDDVQNNDVGTQIMFIEEDLNQLDSLAIGYIEFVDQSNRNQLTFELTDNNKEIIISNEMFTLICNYNFFDSDKLGLDESDGNSSLLAVWTKVD